MTRSGGVSAIVFLAAMVLTLVLDSQRGPVSWLAPPLITGLRALNQGGPELWVTVLRSVLWSAVVLGGYVLVRGGAGRRGRIGV